MKIFLLLPILLCLFACKPEQHYRVVEMDDGCFRVQYLSGIYWFKAWCDYNDKYSFDPCYTKKKACALANKLQREYEQNIKSEKMKRVIDCSGFRIRNERSSKKDKQNDSFI